MQISKFILKYLVCYTKYSNIYITIYNYSFSKSKYFHSLIAQLDNELDRKIDVPAT